MAKRSSKTAAQQCRYYEVDNIFLLSEVEPTYWREILKQTI